MSESLVAGLRASAGRYPGNCAVEAGGQAIDYATLWSRSLAIASWLSRNGVSQGDRVALVLPNSIAYIAAFYGSLIAGAVVVPLNTDAKGRDLAVWLEHSGVRLLVADAGFREVQVALSELPSPCKVLTLDVDGALPDDASAAATGTVFTDPKADHPAVLLYTSGSTGRPKGVLLSHGNLASNAAAIVSYLGITADDSIVTVLPFYYSYGNSVLQSHLMAGARLVLEQNLVYPHAVVETLARRRATGFAGVPSTFALLLARVDLGNHDLSSLRYITQAGGAMSPVLAQKLRAALPHVAVIVMYGQTEATARLTWLPPTDFDRKHGSVGIPIPGVAIEVRGEDGERLAPGEEGEIWARGPNVMLGYWGDPAATADVLRNGWLRTRDEGYLDAEGYLFLKGRRSDIIKVGAHRVHPGEIEDVVVGLDGVHEVAAVGSDDEILGQVIKVFVVAEPGSALTPMRVQAHCRERLASYKVPRFVEFVDSLPKTASGKVQRVVLARERMR